MAQTDAMQNKKEKSEESKTTQVGVRFKEDAITRIDSFIDRFRKEDRASVVREIVLLYIDFYEEIEQRRIDAYREQKSHYNPDAEIKKSSKPDKK
jgi:hypothetical protein